MSAKTVNRVAIGVLWIIAALLVIFLAAFVGYILWVGLRVVNWEFISTEPNYVTGGGVFPFLFNSLYMLFLAMAVTVPLGIGAGIYMAEYARPGPFTSFIRFSTETLASVPSIVMALFGLIVFVNLTGWGYTLLGGALAVTLLNLPVMARVSEEAFLSAPRGLREGSMALGATKWQTIYKVLLPAALPTLITGTILTAGRVFGEAAALLFTSGQSSPTLNFNFSDPLSPGFAFNPFRQGGTLAVYVWALNSESLLVNARQVADGVAALLVITVLIFNISARALGSAMYRRFTAS